MKYSKFFLVATVAMSMAAAGSLASAQNLLVNPGFEDPVTTDGAPFVGFWEAFTGNAGNTSIATADTSTAMPLSGAQSLELVIDGPDAFAGVFQDVAVSAGQTVEFKGFHKSTGPSSFTEIRIEWLDAGLAGLGNTGNINPAPGSTYEPFLQSGVAPVGAAFARSVYAIASFNPAVLQHVFVDDASVFVPEPTSIALLGLAGLATATMRRRK